jgi:hypothetical protein
VTITSLSGVAMGRLNQNSGASRTLAVQKGGENFGGNGQVADSRCILSQIVHGQREHLGRIDCAIDIEFKLFGPCLITRCFLQGLTATFRFAKFIFPLKIAK